MKIKCPSCSKVLGIPESAAGKVVKCPCGKQLKAPGGAGKAPSAQLTPQNRPAAKPAAKRPAPQRPAAKRPTPQRPVAQRSAPAAPLGADAGIFDELTEGDLSGVRAVVQPGKKPVAKTKKKTKQTLDKYASDVKHEEEARKREIREGASREIRTSIGILLTLGLLRFAIGLFFLLNAGNDAAAIAGAEAPEEEIAHLTLLLQIYHGINVTIGGLFLACAGLIFLFPMSCALIALGTYILAEIIGLLINPFRLLDIRLWLLRAVIFGALIQTINNASYYKFVKSGGRDKDIEK